MSETRSVPCAGCGAVLEHRAPGRTVVLTCGHCGVLLDVSGDEPVVAAPSRGETPTLLLSIGARHRIDGEEWEVLGALARSDADMVWTEYLLFSPYRGFRWLVQEDGEWLVGEAVTERPLLNGKEAQWHGRKFTRDYAPVQTTTNGMVGEFYWQARPGEQVSATTYSDGDSLLSAEWSDDEVAWTIFGPLPDDVVSSSLGVYMPFAPYKRPTAKKNALAKAVADGSIVSETGGSFFSRWRRNYRDADAYTDEDVGVMFGFAAVACIAVLLVMVGFGIITGRVSNAVEVRPDGPMASVNVGTLTIDRPYQIVEIRAKATPFENTWFDIDYTLVDRKTQRGYTSGGVIEHYAGYDSDGPWQEGSFQTVTKFTSIPRGSYDVIADVSARTWRDTNAYAYQSNGYSTWASGDPVSVEFTAGAGGVMWRNLWIAVVLLMTIPLVISWWRYETDD